MKPTDFTNDQLKNLISGKDGLLKEALKKGNLQQMAEIVNSVGSILNYNGRQAAQKNLTKAEAAEEKEATDTRVQVCEAYEDQYSTRLTEQKLSDQSDLIFGSEANL